MQTWGLAIALSAVGLSGARTAQAQTLPPPDQIDATPKGSVGLGLIGAEIGLVVPVAAGLKETWSLILFPALGAAGGATAGYFLIDRNDESKLAVGMMATGLALVAPSLVLAAVLGAYNPAKDDSLAVGGATALSEESRRYLQAQRQKQAKLHLRQARRLRAGPGLIKRGEQGWRLGTPGLHLRPEFSRREQQQYAVRSQSRLHVPVLSGVF
ncbi:MAG: hypothetical protein ACPGUV_13505 [Polyangiales bacterium]